MRKKYDALKIKSIYNHIFLDPLSILTKYKTSVSVYPDDD